MTGRKRPRRALAVDAQGLRRAVDPMILERRDVVGDVVHQVHVERLPRAAADAREHLARLLHQKRRLHHAKFAAARIAPRYRRPSALSTGAQTS